MSAAGADRHETLTLRLEVGHESVLLAQPRITYPCAHTHKWTVFVRGQNDTSLEPHLIQKVIFNLHEDFPNPKRVVTAAPFEVSETGYGGFMIPIYILFAHSKKEQYLEYDMNLKYASYDKNKETRVIEFKDPKPELRAKLLKAGAEIIPVKSAKGQGNGSSFQDLFGETLRVTSPSIPVEKPKAPSNLTNAKRQAVSPSGDGLANKVKQGNPTKITKDLLALPASGSSVADLDKKHRKSKDGRPNNSKKLRHGDELNQRPRHPTETSDAAQCLADASKLPPFVSPLGECSWGTVSDLPSTSNVTKVERRREQPSDEYEEEKSKKASEKFRQKGAQNSTGLSPTVQNAKHVQNGSSAADDKRKRKKTKSDSGLDSDYSSGVPNINSPCVVVNGHSSNNITDQNGGNNLFSPPDSVRSLDTLQESPASAASCSSVRSGASSSRHPKKQKDSGEDNPGATTVKNATSDEERLRMLLMLQQKIMTIQEKSVAQLIADTISTQASYEVTSDCLEFDLCTLDSELIQRLTHILDLPTR